MEPLPAHSKHHSLCPSIFVRLNKLGLLCLIALLVGCVPAFQIADNFQQPAPSVRVFLMQPDIQLTELSAGGLQEPRADWTAAARKNITKALTDLLKEREDSLVLYREPKNNPATLHLHNQLIKLHEVVGETILIHKYLPAYALPTKSKGFDWSLGEDVDTLREQHAVDYALFLYIRDSYVSAGRAALMVAAAAFGVGLSGGVQLGFASLVDLRTGQVVWFNRLYRGTGDLRTPEPAREAVQQLLANIPL
ncbi:MAG: hypothetical protein PVG99_10020 [Desulfobacteraceae bacterium]